MSLRASARRWKPKGAGRPSDEDYETAPEPAKASFAPARAAPRAGAATAPRARAPHRPPCRCTTKTRPAGTRTSAARPSGRPAGTGPGTRWTGPCAPKPGKRMAREAQPSLLDEENYQLPPLNLLAEPKRPSVPKISTDALEQNAALLESVLEDFGVRGEIIKSAPARS